MRFGDYTADDFGHSPLMFYFEVTQACDLVCRHCRASAQEIAHPGQLTTDQARALIDQIAAFPKPPSLVLTGGDPLKRRDLFELIAHAAECGLHVALTPSATPLATRDALERAQAAGVRRIGVSLDGADAPTHDAFRGWQGSFDRTLLMMADARSLGLPVQVNTTISRRNFPQLDAMADLLSTQGIAMWAAFFLIPVGRGVLEERLQPLEYEIAFERLFHHAGTQPYAVKTTEAPHYRRFVMEHGANPLDGPRGGLLDRPRGADARHRAPLGIGDGKGIVFVGHTGEIYPSGFLPLECGRFPTDSVIDVYQDHPTFRALRDPDRFQPKCGVCEYRHVCGGSRARAYAATGDPLGEEPDCLYLPVESAEVIRVPANTAT